MNVIDGSGAAGFTADVALAGDRIAAVEPALEGEADEVIEGAGRVLAPGFIDVHTHDDRAALDAKLSLPKVSQGVTTVVVGNCGVSLAPSPVRGNGEVIPPINLLGKPGDFAFPRFADYRARVEEAPGPVNVAALVGHMTLRARTMDELERPASESEIAAMRADLAEALEAGALGLSTGLAYPPSRYAPTSEVVALARDVAAAGRLFTTHMRDEANGVVASVAETISIARQSGVRTLISHHKCCGEGNFGLSATTLAMIAEARETLSIDLDLYPYTASSTVLLASFARQSSKVTVSWSDSHPEMAGRDVAEIAAAWGCDQATAMERLRPGGGIYHQMDEADLRRILTFPPSLVGSDGLPHDKRPHPRLWGTFPRVLGHYVRERGDLSLEQAVAKMTGQTAGVLGLKDRGLVKPGYHADLVLFDPATVLDRATYDDPEEPAAGIDMVLVNGETTYEAGAMTDHRPGRFLAD
ncbi:N-acyl-D-amino-acid deacylase family protein [Pelagibius marinus]|uniref:N-acyl-D-amino-acid deacylase family protein n=1 Tax=Pelagibius marinus TaxID=2762760 RepID=UPI0029CA0286|nr:D-aminoacylase [Pelagibius marinus]